MNLALIRISQSFGSEGAMLMVQLPGLWISSVLVALGPLLPTMIGVSILITFRKGDELHSLCASINAAATTICASKGSKQTSDEAERAA